MSYTNQQPWAGVAGAPDGIVMVRTANFMTLLNGPPQGVLAGQSGSASVPPDMVWDWYGKALYICTQSSGSPAGAVWTEIEFVGPFVGTNIYSETVNASQSITDQGPLTVDGTSSLVGNVTAGANLSVAGNTTIAGSETVQGPFTANGGGVLSGTFTGSPVFNFPLTLQQPLRLPNNVFIQAADTTATYRSLIGCDTSNNTAISNVGGGTIGWLNQSRSAWLLSSTNAGALSAPGSLALGGALSSSSLATGGATMTGATVNGAANVNGTLGVGGGLYPSGNIYNIGGIGNFHCYNSGGQSVFQMAASNYMLFDGANVHLNTTGQFYFGQVVNAPGLVSSGDVNASNNVNAVNIINCNGNIVAQNAVTGVQGVWSGVAGTSFGLFGQGSGYRYLSFASGWSLSYNEGSGELRWQAGHDLLPNGDYGIVGNAFKPGGGPWAAPSDPRIKSVEGPYTGGLEELRRIQPIRYRYRDNPEGRELIGLDAGEAEYQWPSLVFRGRGAVGDEEVDDLRFVDAGEVTWALVNAVCELADRLEARE